MPRRSKHQIKQDYCPGPIGWARRRVFPLLARVLALLGIFILGGWITGRVLTDQHHWSQYLWWMPALWVLLTVLVLAIASLFFAKLARRPAAIFLGPVLWMSLVVCAIYLVAIVWWPMFGRGPSTTKPTNTIRALHWNHAGNPVDHQRLGDEVRRLDVDIVLIANAEWGQPRQSILEQFTHYAPDERERWINYSYKVHADPAHYRVEQSVMIASRFPMTRTGMVRFGSGERQQVLEHSSSGLGWVMFAEFDTDPDSVTDDPLIVWFVDLPSNPMAWKQTEMLAARRAVENWDGGGWRMGRHVWEQHVFVSETFPDPDLVIGDFNITRGSDSLNHLTPNMHDAFEAAGHGPGKSFVPKTSHPLKRAVLSLSAFHIDLTLAADTTRVDGYWLLEIEDALHRAQLVDFVPEN
jgi:hypothetical protein